MSGTDCRDETGGFERLPTESGEKRRERTENPREEDRGSDYLEWCLREFEGTMNKAEEPAPVKSSEEIAVLIDSFGGKVREAEKEEIKRSATEEPEKPAYAILNAGSTLPHEDREVMNKPARSNEVAEASKTKEHETNVNEKTQSTSEGTPPSQHSDRDLQREEGREAERDKKAVIEPREAAEKQQGSQEHNKGVETPPTEGSRRDQDKENDPTVKQDTKHEEGRDSFKLGDDPKAFVEANRELLVKEGITVENNETKLDGKTTLKLDEKEGLTIVHGDQHYKITEVEQRKIGDLELTGYKTKQGEEFLHIPKENKVAPPYETPWYALPKTTSIYLDKQYQRELLTDAKNTAGGIEALQKELEKIGSHAHRDSLYDYWSGRADGMFTEKLIPILIYLNRDLDEPNKHITAIGRGGAIENPKFPFRLDNIDGARLLAARFSDGTLTTPQGRGPRYSYRNNDEEQRNRVAQSLTNAFGKVNTKYIHYTEHGRDRSLITTLPEIVGHTIQRAGAITGEVIKQNPDIPTFVLQGSKEMKREWLKQAFGDEGSPNAMMRAVEMTRAVDVTPRLSDEQRNRLDTLSEAWQRTTYPEGTEQKYNRFSKLPGDIQEALNIRPRLLESEERMLRQDFGIKAEISPGKIYSREGGYGLICVLHITKEDTRTFYNEIGFPQQRKQEKLANMLKNEGGR